jgi:hypothetical protein
LRYNIVAEKQAKYKKMKSLVIAFVICLSTTIVHGEDVKPAKAIGVLGFSDKVHGSEYV